MATMRRYIESLIWNDNIGAPVDGFEQRRWIPAIPDASTGSPERGALDAEKKNARSDAGSGAPRRTRNDADRRGCGWSRGGSGSETWFARAHRDLVFGDRGIPHALARHRAKLRARIAAEQAWILATEEYPELLCEAPRQFRGIAIERARLWEQIARDNERDRLGALPLPHIETCQLTSAPHLPLPARVIAMPRPRPIEKFLFGLDENGASLSHPP
jgi:hypothetical protein